MQPSLTHFAGFRALMLPRLAAIVHTKDLSEVFVAYRAPKILARDIHLEILKRYPEADPIALGNWMRWWTESNYYVKRMLTANNRHDLDGNNVEPISPGQKRSVGIKITRSLNQKKCADPDQLAAQRRFFAWFV